MSFERDVARPFLPRIEVRGDGVSPAALLIACTDPPVDSRLLPLLDSEPMLLWRSPGPVIPPYGSDTTALASLFEEAVARHRVREIVICGHFPSRPLRNLITDPTPVAEPGADPCRFFTQSALRIVRKRMELRNGALPRDGLLRALVEENVALQMAHVRTYPAVLAGMVGGSVKIHGWIYDMEENSVRGSSPSGSRLRSRLEPKVQSAVPSLPCFDPRDIYLA